jgi:hypothetical protein
MTITYAFRRNSNRIYRFPLAIPAFTYRGVC